MRYKLELEMIEREYIRDCHQAEKEFLFRSSVFNKELIKTLNLKKSYAIEDINDMGMYFKYIYLLTKHGRSIKGVNYLLLEIR